MVNLMRFLRIPSRATLHAWSRDCVRWARISLLPALVTAGMLWASFFPLNLGWLSCVALVPLLWIVTDPSAPGVKRAAWVAGLGFFLLATQWIRLASPPMIIAWPILAIILSFAFPIFVGLCRLFVRHLHLPLWLAAPIAWVACEYIRAHINVGFAWYYLGHAQHGYLPFVQFADIFGAYGVSFLIVMLNVALLEAAQYGWAKLWRWRQAAAPPPRTPVTAIIVTTMSLAVALAYGFWRLGQDDFEVGPRLALIQGNLPQHIHDDPDAMDQTAKHYRDLADEANKHEPDLIVWSETSWPQLYMAIDGDVDRGALPKEWLEAEVFTRDIRRDMAFRYRRPMLLGLNSVIHEVDGPKHYNTAVLLDAAGEVHGIYHKRELVPFGECIPYEEYLPFMKWLSPYDEASAYGIKAGKSLTVFPFQGRHFAVLICYEDSVPHLAPAYLKRRDDAKAAPHFFINISNDGWFHGSEEHEQHLVAARFRAIECRRAVARAVNMGVSCVIDSNGRLIGLPGPSISKSKGFSAIVVANVPIDHRGSLYVWWGDVLPIACWLMSGMVLVIAIIRRKKHCKSTSDT
jgi:apolipoprotein N-acyltransferase